MRQEGERAGEKEDRTAQESKPDPSSNASVRSYGFSLEQRIVTVADREDRDRGLNIVVRTAAVVT